MNKKLVSIIIPVYNVELFLDSCLKSVIDQTYKNIEILLINDGSTDNSANICIDYSKIDSRIKVFNKENGGLSDARNYGLNYAKGEYVFFLDSDDLLQSNTIEILYKYLKNNSIVICELDRFKNNYSYDSSNIIINEYTPKEYFSSILELNNNTYACGNLIPRQFLNDIRFIKGRYFEDMATMYYIYHKCSKIMKMNLKMYKYRYNPNSIIHTINTKKIDDCLYIY